LQDGGHQARYVVEQVRRLRREGYAWRDLAVLYRAHHHAMELQMALAEERIPYLVTSGVRFFEQAHVKDACSLLRLLHNPGDEAAFTRLLGLLPGVGQRTAVKLWAALGKRVDLKDPAQGKALAERLPAAARGAWQALAPVSAAYEAENLKEDPGELVFQFLRAFYDQVLLDTFEDYERRRDDLQEMIGFMSGFESAEAFLNEVALVSNVDAEPDLRASQAGDVLRLSSVHQAKGLEWKAVIIIWAADGMFPSSRALKEAAGEDEERRLFYVAVTRAKDELMLCVPEVRRMPDGGVNFLAPSRFLAEIPPERLRQEQVGFL
jgi:DNA helicase-2/ATP-dependent DNA helicase PcrA